MAALPPAVLETVQACAYVTYYDEAGFCYTGASDWVFVQVEHKPIFARVRDLTAGPPVRSMQGVPEIRVIAKCEALLFGGISNPYAPDSGSSMYPTGFRFNDGSGPLIVTGIVGGMPGETWAIAGRVYYNGGNPALESYWGQYITQEHAGPENAWFNRILAGVGFSGAYLQPSGGGR